MWQGVLGPEGQRGAVWAPHPATAQLLRFLWTPSQGRCVCTCVFVHVHVFLSPLVSVKSPCLSLLLSDVVMVVPVCLCVQLLYNLGGSEPEVGLWLAASPLHTIYLLPKLKHTNWMACWLRYRKHILYFFPLSLSLQYLLHYLLSVKSLVNRHAWSRTPVAETSWALLRDCYHGAMCICHKPQHIAIATLYLALNSYGVELPVGEKEWWQVCICDKLFIITDWREGLSKIMCASKRKKQFINLSLKCDILSPSGQRFIKKN